MFLESPSWDFPKELKTMKVALLSCKEELKSSSGTTQCCFLSFLLGNYDYSYSLPFDHTYNSAGTARFLSCYSTGRGQEPVPLFTVSFLAPQA